VRDEPLPLKPVDDDVPKRPTLAPAWLALVTPWLGLLMLVLAVVFPFLPGTKDPRAELEHLRPPSFADRFLPVPMYGITVTLFLGIIVLWQMRREPRPLPPPLIAQRIQAWAGIGLAAIATIILYIYIALHGPKS
jgi:hypothetical protein